MTSELSLRRFSTSDAQIRRSHPVGRLYRQNSCNPRPNTAPAESPASPPSLTSTGIVSLFKRLRSSSVLATSPEECEESCGKPRRESEERTVRNIYRRPSRRNRNKPKVSSVGELRRKQFAGTSRSEAWEDDDDADDDEQTPPTKAALTFTSSDTSSIARKSSILRRPRSKSMPAVSNRPKAPPKEKKKPQKCQKQTSFRENVEVIYYDEHGTAVSNLSCMSEKLKTSSNEDLFEEEICDINKNCLEGLHGPVQRSGDGDKSGGDVTGDDVDEEPRRTVRRSEEETAPSTLVSCCLSGVVVHPKSGAGRPLRGIRLKIEIDEQCIRTRTKVKVLSSGTSVLVMTYKDVEGGVDQEETIERIDLPVVIDPYSVKAQVKTNGSLTVEAPIKN
ncbi:hypothetical protein CAPTEDRAFT_227779 [Capitella teleta]|uniref:SHSP domain-containing protein n=1 Tax=Capitella teleta TaxID=283909 RepID=R7VJ57_CAPTE|nr:hypothetical protein CAPTEDRAFT_227779 [Capitella teleta]|eukprot:ELU16361.1 hypothetical protein CAPTEDRAFT_227779 [Capitella teleta]